MAIITKANRKKITSLGPINSADREIISENWEIELKPSNKTKIYKDFALSHKTQIDFTLETNGNHKCEIDLFINDNSLEWNRLRLSNNNVSLI